MFVTAHVQEMALCTWNLASYCTFKNINSIPISAETDFHPSVPSMDMFYIQIKTSAGSDSFLMAI